MSKIILKHAPHLCYIKQRRGPAKCWQNSNYCVETIHYQLYTPCVWVPVRGQYNKMSENKQNAPAGNPREPERENPGRDYDLESCSDNENSDQSSESESEEYDISIGARHRRADMACKRTVRFLNWYFETHATRRDKSQMQYYLNAQYSPDRFLRRDFVD